MKTKRKKMSKFNPNQALSALQLHADAQMHKCASARLLYAASGCTILTPRTPRTLRLEKPP